jgi:hypothetical protein
MLTLPPSGFGNVNFLNSSHKHAVTSQSGSCSGADFVAHASRDAAVGQGVVEDIRKHHATVPSDDETNHDPAFERRIGAEPTSVGGADAIVLRDNPLLNHLGREPLFVGVGAVGRRGAPREDSRSIAPRCQLGVSRQPVPRAGSAAGRLKTTPDGVSISCGVDPLPSTAPPHALPVIATLLRRGAASTWSNTVVAPPKPA